MIRTQKLNYAIAIILGIGILCFIVKWLTEMFDATKSTATANGALVEPTFFLIPVGWLFLIIGVILVMVKIVTWLALVNKPGK
jgi:hypothetical protein